MLKKSYTANVAEKKQHPTTLAMNKVQNFRQRLGSTGNLREGVSNTFTNLERWIQSKKKYSNTTNFLLIILRQRKLRTRYKRFDSIKKKKLAQIN